MSKTFAPLLATGLLALGLIGCSPVVATRGNMTTDEQLAKIEPGETSRTTVQYVLGTPTATSTTDQNTWYYIGRRMEQTAFFAPEVAAQRIVRIRFDENNVVQSMDEIDAAEQRYVDPVERSTPTAGIQPNFFEQLFGNLNRQRPKKEEEKK